MTKTKKPHAKDKTEVIDHYLDYPYPLRDPEDEKTRLLQIDGENLHQINHYLFKGKEDFNKGFRVLVAGGGTGDSSTYLGEQLKNKNAEIVYLDFSKNSMEIAKKRAEYRGIKNIKFINDSIFNIPNLDLGKFDYINCSGVLHHLVAPQEGLQILQGALKPEGGVNVMVYAKYGRTAVYQIQDLMKRINEGVTKRDEEVKNARVILSSLPQTNWYMRAQDLISDIKNYGDVGIYDLFLHKQDRCYSIEELYDFIENANLNFTEWSEILPRLTIRVENFVSDPAMLAKIKAMDARKQQAIVEIIAGNIIKHTFYASNLKDPVAKFDDMNNVPFFFGIAGIVKDLCNYLENNAINQAQNVSMTINSVWVPQGINISIPLSEYTLPFLKAMGDEINTKSFGEILEEMNKTLGKKVDEKSYVEFLQKTLPVFVDSGILLLRDKSVKI